MNKEDLQKSEDARKFIKENVKLLINSFTDKTKYLPDDNPVSIFMAGAPGAGKTEFSKNLISVFEDMFSPAKIVRIDSDEIREILPGYSGDNSSLFQGACSLGVEKIHDFVLNNNQNFLLDGTLANYEKARSNIQRSLDKGREVSMFFVYQEPFIAWEFTKKREKVEHRNIPKESFIKEFIDSRENINKIKKYFGNKIHLNLIIKNYKNNTEHIESDIDNVDRFINKTYNKNELNNILRCLD